jgi:hypothetical protein
MNHHLPRWLGFFNFCLFMLGFSPAFTQSPGLIYKPSSTTFGKSILDPNGDGFSSPTAAGFIGTDYGEGSELRMVPLPVVSGEPFGDLTTGASGGSTDIVSVSNNNQSCYIMYREVSGVSYLIFRFRLGGASTAAKGYSFLIDTDGQFAGTGNNPGFEKEVVLNTGSAGAVVVNTFNSSGGVTGTTSFNVNEYSQRSIAISTINASADYFYDFFIPYSALGLSTEPVRIATATIISAGSGITGTKADYNGINDKTYGNNPAAIGQALMNAFPATSLTSLTEGASFANPRTLVPVVNAGITTASNSISGTSTEAAGTVITVYKGGSSIGTTTVDANASWTLTGVSGLAAGNLITADALAGGKTISGQSSAVEVTTAQSCFTNAPTLSNPTASGSKTIDVSWSWPSGVTPTANSVVIKVFQITESSTGTNYTLQNGGVTQYMPTTGVLRYSLSGAGVVSGSFVATATYNTCTSGYGNTLVASSPSTTTTAAPTIETTPLYASIGSRDITVKNNHTSTAKLILYVNGEQKSISGLIAAGASHTFSYSGLIDGDIVQAKAEGSVSTNVISVYSNTVTVSASSTQTAAPVIGGTYVAGATAVEGTSTEAAGTTITLYKAGTTLLGTTTVTAYGVWSVSAISLSGADVLTAYAKAGGKILSAVSNSKTVASSAPSKPVITPGTYTSQTTSISGTGGSGTITIYVDGSPIGTTSTGTAWTLSSIAAGQLYRGAIITATNTVAGVEGPASDPVTVTGVTSFLITNTSDGSIGTQVAGIPFNIKIAGKDGSSGSGNTFTAFVGNVTISSSANMVSGGGETSSFAAGVLSSHSLSLQTSGSGKTITAVSVDDPSATGTANIALINPNVQYKLVLSAPANFLVGSRASYTITRKDYYDNPTTSGAMTIYLSASGSTGQFYDAASGGSTITSLTIPDGQSAVSFWFTATSASNYTITASDASPADGNTGLHDATDAISATAAVANKFLVTTSSYVSLNGNLSVTAQLSDAYDNPVPTAGVSVNWASNKAGTFSSGAVSNTNASGLASINFNQSAVVGTVHTITATAGSITGSATTTVVSGKVWTGRTGNQSNQNGNWQDNAAPVGDEPLYFDANPDNPLTLDGDQSFSDIFFNGTGPNHRVILNGKKLTIKGNINLVGSGRIKANATGDEIELAGSSAQTIPASTFENDEVTNLKINNGNGVTLGGPTIIKGTLTPTAGALTSNGNLTLRSNGSGTARVGQGSSSGGYVVGNVNTERHLSRTTGVSRNGRAWRLVSIPVTGTGTLKHFFMAGQSGTNLTVPGNRSTQPTHQGTVVVGHNYADATSATNAGFDWIGVANQVSSLRRYVADVSGGSFSSSAVPSMDTKYDDADQGYMIFARGDRQQEYNGTTNSSTTTLLATGTLKQGSQSVTIPPLSTAGFVLVGNPYMSLLDMEKVYIDNPGVISTTIYIWDANIDGNVYKQGGYRAVTRMGANNWESTGGVTNPQYIESGSAFFVKPTVTGGGLQIHESHKVLGTAGIAPHAVESEGSGLLYVNLEVTNAGEPSRLVDGVVAHFDQQLKESLGDALDIESLANITTGSISLSTEGKTLSMEGRSWPKDTLSKSLQIRMRNMGNDSYILRIIPKGMIKQGFTAYLKDHHLKSETEIDLDKETAYPFRQTANIAVDSGRFELLYRMTKTTLSGNLLPDDASSVQAGMRIFPNPAKNSDVRISLLGMDPGLYQVKILDMEGRLISTMKLEHRTANAVHKLVQGRHLPQGRYVVQLTDTKQKTHALQLTIQ